jgi:uncharacterized membrane protein YciS (DUF1049 family)
MRIFCFIILVAILAALAVFVFQNDEAVTLHYLGRSLSAPMAALIGAVYFLGMVSGWTVLGFLRRTFRRATDRPPDVQR